MWATSEEIKYALECDYKEIYLIQGIVSRSVGRPFKKFIDDHYKMR